MIAVSSSGQHFGKLANYLVKPRDGVDRVDWLTVRNLPTADAHLAARFMQATAAANTRVEAPMYHLAVAFHPGDVVDRQMMEGVADRLLAELKLQGHQVVIVAHKDRPHAHMHLMVNRVHPETGRAWDRWQDRVTTQRVLREEERALGLREVRGRLHQLEGQPMPDRTRVTSGEYRETARSGAEPLVEEIRKHASWLRQSRSWDELHAGLATFRYRIERKGQGFVITDGEHEVKASRVHRDLSFSRLEARLGPFQAREAHPDMSPRRDRSEHAHSVETARFRGVSATNGAPGSDRVAELADLVRQAERASRLSTLSYYAREDRSRATYSLEQLQWAEGRARAFSKDFDRALTRVYARPADARELFDHAVRTAGAHAAARRMFEQPEAYGALRQGRRKVAWGLIPITDTREARSRVTDAVQQGRHAAEAAATLREKVKSMLPAGTAVDVARAEAYVHAVTHMTTRLRHAEQRLGRIRAAQATLPDSGRLELDVSRAVLALAPRQVRLVMLLLTDPQRAIIDVALRLARDLVLGRGLGR